MQHCKLEVSDSDSNLKMPKNEFLNLSSKFAKRTELKSLINEVIEIEQNFTKLFTHYC
jgi:hypothetical protein